MSQTAIRQLILLEIAKDISNLDYTCLKHEARYTTIAYSKGKHGINGVLIRGESGKLYAAYGYSTLIDYFI